MADQSVLIFGAKFAARRNELFQRQVDTAERAKVSLRTINNIETMADHRVRRSTIPRLALALKLEPDAFEKGYVRPDVYPAVKVEVPDVAPLSTVALDELLNRIIAERECRFLSPLPEHVESAVLKRAAKLSPRQG